MKTILRYIIISFIFSSFILKAGAQNYKNDLEQMYKAYNNIKNLHAEAEIRIFEDHDSKNYNVAKKIVVKKQGDSFYYSLGQYIIVLTQDEHLLINKGAKTLYYSERDKNDNKSALEQTIPDLDSIINTADTIIFVGYDNTTLHYTITASRNTIQTTEVFIDKNSKLIKKLIYYYNTDVYEKNNKVEVYFSILNTSPALSAGDFSLSKYITKSGNTVKPNKLYADYSLRINEHNR